MTSKDRKDWVKVDQAVGLQIAKVERETSLNKLRDLLPKEGFNDVFRSYLGVLGAVDNTIKEMEKSLKTGPTDALVVNVLRTQGLSKYIETNPNGIRYSSDHPERPEFVMYVIKHTVDYWIADLACKELEKPKK